MAAPVPVEGAVSLPLKGAGLLDGDGVLLVPSQRRNLGHRPLVGCFSEVLRARLVCLRQRSGEQKESLLCLAGRDFWRRCSCTLRREEGMSGFRFALLLVAVGVPVCFICSTGGGGLLEHDGVGGRGKFTAQLGIVASAADVGLASLLLLLPSCGGAICFHFLAWCLRQGVCVASRGPRGVLAHSVL